MENMITCREAAVRWNFTERWVSILCSQGRIPGAVKSGHRWLIPADTKKPADSRIKTGAYQKEGRNQILPLPLGISDYKRVSSEYLYLDKTLFLKSFLEEKSPVSVFTAPPGFGKSLLLDMMRAFLEISDEDASLYFQNRRIYGAGKRFRAHMGKYPVIRLSFSDLNFRTFAECKKMLLLHLQEEFVRHGLSGNTGFLPDHLQNACRSILSGEADETELVVSLLCLCRCLSFQFSVPPVVLIDDYDVPVLSGIRYHYEEELLEFFSRFYGEALRDAKNHSFAVLCGVQSFDPTLLFESIPSVQRYTVLEDGMRFFGFSVEDILSISAAVPSSDAPDMLKWYGGYLFGDTQRVGSLSVLRYLSGGCIPKNVHPPVSDLQILSLFIKSSFEGSPEELGRLLDHNDLCVRIQNEPELASLKAFFRACETGEDINMPLLYYVMVERGLLTGKLLSLQPDGNMICRISLPNEEIATLFRREVLRHLMDNQIISASHSGNLQEALFLEDPEKIRKSVRELLYVSVSRAKVHDASYYQALLIALMVISAGLYIVTAGQDADGDCVYYDMLSRKSTLPDIRIEVREGRTVKIVYRK